MLTRNFSILEFACHDGTPVPGIYLQNVTELAKNLQVLRDYLGKSIMINSGYRTESWNRKVGGKINSYHLKAMAADIVVRDIKPETVRAAIEHLIKEGKMKQGGIGSYTNFTHYDIRGFKARW